MKFRYQKKASKNGFSRWWLVSSARDKSKGKPSPIWHEYIGYQPNAKLAKLLDRLNNSLKQAKELHADNKILAQIREEKIQLRKMALIKRRKNKEKQLEASIKSDKAWRKFPKKVRNLELLFDELVKKHPIQTWSNDEWNQVSEAFRPIIEFIGKVNRCRDKQT